MNTLNEYKELHQNIYTCVLCKSIGKDVQRVQPKWDENRKPRRIKKWGLIVGQAPGLTEKKISVSSQKSTVIREKIPFSGKAGQQLKKWFTKVNIDHDIVFNDSLVTSLTKCYPGRIKGMDRKPSMKEVKLCEPFLLKQIKLISPKLIIPIGRQSINWFFPKERNKKMSEKIGYLRKWGDYDIVCLPHPSPASAIIKKEEIKEKISDSIKIINKQWEIWN